MENGEWRVENGGFSLQGCRPDLLVLDVACECGFHVASENLLITGIFITGRGPLWRLSGGAKDVYTNV